MATKKKAEPVKPVSSRAKPKKDKLPDVVEEYNDLVAEQQFNPEFIDSSQLTGEPGEILNLKAEADAGLIEPDCDQTVVEQPVSTSGLLAHFPNGETREPTHEELVEMGRAIAERIFGNRNVLLEPVAMPDAPPKPKISGNHCRLCKSFAGNDPRGALWSDSGHCLTYNHVQSPVEPEHYCNRFVFDEALRDAEPR